GFESLLMTYVLNSLWQVPLIVVAAWMAARVVRPIGPGAEHRVWVGALLGEAMLPVASMMPWERLHVAWPWNLHAVEAPAGNIVVQVGAGVASGGLRLPGVVIAAVSVVYAALTMYFAARFAWRWWRLRELSRAAAVVTLSGAAGISWRRWLARLGAE